MPDEPLHYVVLVDWTAEKASGVPFWAESGNMTEEAEPKA